MTYLWLKHEHVQAIIRHAKQTSPQEACGLILGTAQTVSGIVQTQNIAADKQHQFRVDDVAVVKHFDQIIGIYHSHPRGTPIPSPTDIQESCYPEFIHVIVGLQGQSPRLAAWRIRYGRVDSVQIQIGTQPPLDVPQELTLAQRVAILLGTLLVALFVLFISLTLLPPAPPIP